VIAATLDELRVPIDSVRGYPRNPRRGDVAAIRRSLEVNGQYRPIVVNRRSGEVLAGNHTLAAAAELGWSEIAATFVDVDEEQARRIVLADNRLSDLAGYDDAELAALLASLPELDGTAWESNDLAQLLMQIEQRARDPGRDTDPGHLPAQAQTQPGWLYALGEHRLVCGDALDPAAHDALGCKPVCILTDPPYGIGLDTDYTKLPIGSSDAELALSAKRRSYRPMIGDDEPFDASTIVARYPRAREQFWFGADYYRRTLSANDLDGSYLVWDKRSETTDGVLGSGFELIWSRQPHKRDLLRHYWCGAIGAAEARKRMHPTQKPVALLAEILERWTKAGAVVLDPFAGSGSTLIACENLGRRCYAIEIDAGYCDVIVDRWQRHTGQEATRA